MHRCTQLLPDVRSQQQGTHLLASHICSRTISSRVAVASRAEPLVSVVEYVHDLQILHP